MSSDVYAFFKEEEGTYSAAKFYKRITQLDEMESVIYILNQKGI